MTAPNDQTLDGALIRDARRREIERLRTMRGLDLDRPKVMSEAWRFDEVPSKPDGVAKRRLTEYD